MSNNRSCRVRRSAHQKRSLAARLLVGAVLMTGLTFGAAEAAGVSLGATVELTCLTPAQRTARLARLKESGVTHLRYVLDWNRVEPKPGQFVWAADDAGIGEARVRGFEVMLVLGPTAVWAVDPAYQLALEQARHSVPKQAALWERYVRQAATHYRGTVQYWQIREQPNTRQFRGAVQEYEALLSAAAKVLRQVDPRNRIIAPESVALDPGGLDRRLQPPTGKSWDIWGAYLPGREAMSPGALSLSVMATEALASAGPAKQVWVVGAEAPLSAERWRQYYLLAAAFGVERFYAPAEVIDQEWAAAASGLEYRGYLQVGPKVWALVFRCGGEEVVAAWSEAPTCVSASNLALVGRAQTRGGGGAVRVLGPRPVLLRGLDTSGAVAGAPRREAVLGGRGEASLRQASCVSADYNRAEAPEQGLYNRALRALPGGAVREATFDGRRALGTELHPTNRPRTENEPWMYFDVEDAWLYFARGRAPVTVTIEVHACGAGPQRVGFNVYYDSTSGYRATKWQWVEAGEGWRTYRVVLPDASFTNRNGYDFRINAQGSREDLWVGSVRVSREAAGAR